MWANISCYDFLMTLRSQPPLIIPRYSIDSVKLFLLISRRHWLNDLDIVTYAQLRRNYIDAIKDQLIYYNRSVNIGGFYKKGGSRHRVPSTRAYNHLCNTNIAGQRLLLRRHFCGENNDIKQSLLY